MTNDEKLKAFALRLDGLTWERIAEELHYSVSTVEHDMLNCLRAHCQTRCVCIYPTVKKVLLRDYRGSITALSTASGIPYGTLYDCLTGRHYSRKTAARVSAFLGLPPEEVFAREAANE